MTHRWVLKWLTYMRDKTHMTRNNSRICVTRLRRLTYMCDKNPSTWLTDESSFTHQWVVSCGWVIQKRDMTHVHVKNDSFVCETWFIHMCDMTHAYVWHDSFICVGKMSHKQIPWLMTHLASNSHPMCAMTHSYVLERRHTIAVARRVMNESRHA